ncbi:LysR family transcriptional regulator [uncultured Shewanella sp.]|uniref:LysR family transcriptional regulator n=1 Tax=uncultured Shewanella sp. TaxID=173975 RepID=UPI0026044DD4|nr:LysR family transcriptional regulator [uncultured Shewanella sp.]
MNYDVSLFEIKLFLMTKQYKNFSQVARLLDMTPSSVSRKMAQLETKMNTQLLHRHTRAISLTDEGVAFARYGGEIMHQYSLVTEQIEQNSNSPRGLVKISAPVAFAHLHIAPYIPELLSRYPLIKLEMQQTDSFVEPVTEGIDLLIRIGVIKNSSMRMKRFATQHYVMAASPSYLKRYGTPHSPEELMEHNCLVIKGINGLQPWYIGKDKPLPYHVTGAFYCNNADTLVSTAIEGGGIILFPTWLIGDALKAGKLVSIMNDYQLSTTTEAQTINALYLDTQMLAPKVRVVIDFLSQKFGSPCYWDKR